VAKSEYERYLEAPNAQIANEIASKAHARVYGVFEPLIFDEHLSESVRNELNAAFHRVANRALARKRRNKVP